MSDISVCVKNVLEEIGRADALSMPIDRHSGIELEFKGDRTIVIYEEQERVWLRAPLGVFDEGLLRHDAAGYLPILMEENDAFVGRHAFMLREAHVLFVSVLVENKVVVNAVDFGNAIGDFYDIVLRMAQCSRV